MLREQRSGGGRSEAQPFALSFLKVVCFSSVFSLQRVATSEAWLVCSSGHVRAHRHCFCRGYTVVVNISDRVGRCGLLRLCELRQAAQPAEPQRRWKKKCTK